MGYTSVSPQGKFFSQRGKVNKKSLNYDKRLREHKKIVDENQAMLKRLQGKTSNFDVVKWHKDEAERGKLLQMKSNFKGDDLTRHYAKMDFALFTSGFNYRGQTPQRKFFETSMFGRGSLSVRSARNSNSARKKGRDSNMLLKLNNKRKIVNSQVMKQDGDANYHHNAYEFVDDQAKISNSVFENNTTYQTVQPNDHTDKSDGEIYQGTIKDELSMEQYTDQATANDRNR